MDTGIYELDREASGLQNGYFMLLRGQNCDFRRRLRTMIFPGKNEKIFNYLLGMTDCVIFM